MGKAAVVRSIGWVTFLEIIRDKVLYNIALCSFLLLGIGFFASRLSFIRQDRIITDFGISAIAISCAMIAIFTGASLLGREFDRRTIFVALSRPISRLEFVVGKFAGLGLVLALNWFLLSTAFLIILWQTAGGNPFELLTSALVWGILLILMQTLLIASLALFFSSFSTTSLSVIFTIGLYLAGNNISQIRFLAARVGSAAAALLLNFAAVFLPNLEYFNLGLKVTYGLPVSFKFGIISVLYGSFLISLLLLLAGVLIQKREA